MLTPDTPLGFYRFLVDISEDYPESPQTRWTVPIRAWSLADAFQRYRNIYPIVAFEYYPDKP